MKSETTQKRVVRWFLPWNDEKEEGWLMEQARSGWSVVKMGCFGYTFERAAPAEIAYRFDVRPSRRHDRQEYLSLFRDAGWEQVGRRGLWYLFRKAVTNGFVPEIHTDNVSRIAKYRRIIAFMAIMTTIIASQIASRGENAHWGAATCIQMTILTLLIFFIARLLLRIRSLRNVPNSQG